MAENNQLIPVDIFGNVIIDDDEISCRAGRKVDLASCSECGSSFETARRAGRPHSFCSQDCRVRHAKAQRKAFIGGEDQPERCAACGGEIPRRAGRNGRFRRFCSPYCQKRGPREGGRQIDLLTMINQSKG